MKRSDRPRVVTNLAITADGKVTTRTYAPSGFTSEADRVLLRQIRADADAVMVGAGTAKADATSLGLSDPALRAARVADGRPPEPLRVVVSNSGRIGIGSKVVRHVGAPLVIFSTDAMPARLRSPLAQAADVWLFDNIVDLPQVLTILRRDYGIRRLLCEGGPMLFRSMALIDAIDEMFVTLAPVVFGGFDAPTLCGLPAHPFPRPTHARLADMKRIGDECFLHYVVTRRAAGH